jgi:hypothetical protein
LSIAMISGAVLCVSLQQKNQYAAQRSACLAKEHKAYAEILRPHVKDSNSLIRYQFSRLALQAKPLLNFQDASQGMEFQKGIKYFYDILTDYQKLLNSSAINQEDAKRFFKGLEQGLGHLKHIHEERKKLNEAIADLRSKLPDIQIEALVPIDVLTSLNCSYQETVALFVSLGQAYSIQKGEARVDWSSVVEPFLGQQDHLSSTFAEIDSSTTVSLLKISAFLFSHEALIREYGKIHQMSLVIKDAASSLQGTPHSLLQKTASTIRDISTYLENRKGVLCEAIYTQDMGAIVLLDSLNMELFHNDLTWCIEFEGYRNALSNAKQRFTQFSRLPREVSGLVNPTIAAGIEQMRKEFESTEATLIAVQRDLGEIVKTVYDHLNQPYDHMPDHTQIQDRLSVARGKATKCLEEDLPLAILYSTVLSLAQSPAIEPSQKAKLLKELQPALLDILPWRTTEPGTFKESCNTLFQDWQSKIASVTNPT